MRKIIMNSKVLILPILIGMACLLFYCSDALDSSVFIFMGICCVITAAVLYPFMQLAIYKPWYIRLLYGIVSVVCIFVLVISLFMIARDYMLGYIVLSKAYFTSWFKVGVILFKILIVAFLPFDITVILCFLLNDIYAKKNR